MTTPRGYPYPSGSDPVDVPGDLQALAEAVDSDVAAAVHPLELPPDHPNAVARAAAVDELAGRLGEPGRLVARTLAAPTRVVGADGFARPDGPLGTPDVGPGYTSGQAAMVIDGGEARAPSGTVDRTVVVGGADISDGSVELLCVPTGMVGVGIRTDGDGMGLYADWPAAGTQLRLRIRSSGDTTTYAQTALTEPVLDRPVRLVGEWHGTVGYAQVRTLSGRLLGEIGHGYDPEVAAGLGGGVALRCFSAPETRWLGWIARSW